MQHAWGCTRTTTSVHQGYALPHPVPSASTLSPPFKYLAATSAFTHMFCRRNHPYSLHFPVRTSSMKEPPAFTPHSLQHWRGQKRAQLQQHCARIRKAGRRRTVKTCAALPSLPGKKGILLSFQNPAPCSKMSCICLHAAVHICYT